MMRMKQGASKLHRPPSRNRIIMIRCGVHIQSRGATDPTNDREDVLTLDNERGSKVWANRRLQGSLRVEK